MNKFGRVNTVLPHLQLYLNEMLEEVHIFVSSVFASWYSVDCFLKVLSRKVLKLVMGLI